MTVLIVGSGGQVGRALIERAGADARGLDRASCDICDQSSVARVLDATDLSMVVNCAAYTAVDRAESDRTQAFAVNEQGARVVARAAWQRGLPIIHLSTDYVYAGGGNGPHCEDEPAAPLNVYGESKAGAMPRWQRQIRNTFCCAFHGCSVCMAATS